MQTRHLTLVALLALAACVAPPPPLAPKTVSAPPPVAAPAPAPKLVGDWNDWPFTRGDWTYRRDNQGSVGSFGAPGQNTKVSLRCDVQNRRVYLAQEATAGRRMVIRTSSSSKEFATRAAGTNPVYVTAEIQPTDAILDAMAFSRGRILLETDGQQPVILPSWAEITRIVEDCRG
jgi:hypothetical protein